MNEIEIWCKHFFFPRILLLVYVNECSFCWDNVSPNIQRSKVDVVGTTWIHSYGFKNDNINKPIVFKTKHEWDIFNRFSRSISFWCPDFFVICFFSITFQWSAAHVSKRYSFQQKTPNIRWLISFAHLLQL